MLWLAVHLPLLSLEAFCATLLPAAADPAQAATSASVAPVALVAEHRISAVNAQAAACGIRPGIKRATALALAGDLVLGQADAARDARALLALAYAALAFTPAVTLEGPGAGAADTVLLEVQASLRYFGGIDALLRRLAAALAPLGHQLQLASAPTALGAALLARWKDGLVQGPHSTQLPALQALLDAAPVWLLGPGREHWEALQGMGLRTLSDLRQLPRAGLARRFGAGLLDDLDRALGLRPDPRSSLVLPASFDSRLELFARADTTAQVLHGASLLLAQLVAWVQAQRARVAAFTLRMHHEPLRTNHEPLRGGNASAEATELRIELAQPSADGAHLQLLLRERLARIELAAPTLELQLRCTQITRSAPGNGELFPSRHSESEDLARLIERLRARLGDAQVQRVQLLPDHRPECASQGLPLQGWPSVPARRRAGAPSLSAEHAAPSGNVAPAAMPLHRPVWLLPEPLALPERGSLPCLDGHALRLLAGPERIESGWWDAALAARDYFIAQAADGALVWVYRTRLPQPDASLSAAGWFMHGRFG